MDWNAFRQQALFWSKVDVQCDADCWPWRAGFFRDGYGAFGINRRNQRAHRVAYSYAFGPISDDLDILHRCDNRACCNPKHLFTGDQLANMRDKVSKNRQTRGRAVNTNKLTEDQVLMIRAQYAAGGITHQVLADRYGVNKSTIGYVIRRKNWAWLK